MPRRLLVALLAVFVVAGACVAFIALRRAAEEPLPPVPDFGSAEPGAIPAPRAKPFGYGRAVVIAVGTNQYPNLSGGEDGLKYAEADAAGVATLVAERFGYEPVPLLGPLATKAGIELAVKKTAAELGPDDALIFFFAGHGQVVELPGAGEAGFLVPRDAALDLADTSNPATWADQAVNVHDLFALASASKAKHVLFVLDACKSGIATTRGTLAGATDLRSFVTLPSRAVLTATRADQAAREVRDLGHGRFTAALLARLRSDEPASAFDLYQQIQREVANKTKGSMVPQFGQIDGDGMVVFIPTALPKDEVERDLRGAPVGGLSGVERRAADARSRFTTAEQVLEAFRTPDFRSAPDAEDRAKKWESKFARYRMNAGLGDARAMAAMYFCYAKGLGTKPDAAAALQWAKQVHRENLPQGLGRWVLGLANQDGTGLGGKNPEAAEKLFRESAGLDFAPAKLSLARMLKIRRRLDLKEIETLLFAADEQGLPDASAELGELFIDREPAGSDTSPKAIIARRTERVAKAKMYFEKAAAAGVPRGDFGLYLIYSYGVPGYPEPDTQLAAEYLRKSEASEMAEALYHLGRAYEDDPEEIPFVKFKTDRPRALNYYERACQQNYAPALHRSAILLENGAAGAVNVQLARERVEASIAKDYPPAYGLKGAFLQAGRIYAKNEEDAVDWVRLGAEKGDPRSCAAFAMMYQSGIAKDAKPVHDADKFNSNSHQAAHWFMCALVMDQSKRCVGVQKIATAFLFRLTSDAAAGTAGQPDRFGRGTPRTEVLRRWAEEDPGSFRVFTRRFMDR